MNKEKIKLAAKIINENLDWQESFVSGSFYSSNSIWEDRKSDEMVNRVLYCCIPTSFRVKSDPLEEVQKAFYEGRRIQCKSKYYDTDGAWINIPQYPVSLFEPCWWCSDYEWRIAPEPPTWSPWSIDNLPNRTVRVALKYSNPKYYYVSAFWCEKSVFLKKEDSDDYKEVTYQKLFDNYIQENGDPCGKMI